MEPSFEDTSRGLCLSHLLDIWLKECAFEFWCNSLRITIYISDYPTYTHSAARRCFCGDDASQGGFKCGDLGFIRHWDLTAMGSRIQCGRCVARLKQITWRCSIRSSYAGIWMRWRPRRNDQSSLGMLRYCRCKGMICQWKRVEVYNTWRWIMLLFGMKKMKWFDWAYLFCASPSLLLAYV